MSEVWKSLPGAPKPGARVCALAEVPETGAISVDLGGFPVLVLRSGGRLRAFVNACPHQYLPLDWRKPDIVSPDGAVIRCSNHDAGFDAETGIGIDGLGSGCALDPVPVRVADGDVVIGD